VERTDFDIEKDINIQDESKKRPRDASQSRGPSSKRRKKARVPIDFVLALSSKVAVVLYRVSDVCAFPMQDQKFGFGGKKSLQKLNDRESTSDVSGFHPKKNKFSAFKSTAASAFPKGSKPKGGAAGKGRSKSPAQRPGKAKRQQSRGQPRK